MEKYFNISLPKWPALVVKGKPVTKEQAMEILIRTDNLYFSANDREFESKLKEIFYELDWVDRTYGAEDEAIKRKLNLDPAVKHIWNEVWDYKEQKAKDIKHISLGYLSNSQIISSWIGGPHGWCDWDGNINASNYNIGKWPSVEEVYNEWTQIAQAFPYLDLKAQLFNHEASSPEMSDNPGPVIEFTVKNGKVEMSIPSEPLDNPEFGANDMMARFSNPYAERGCTIEKFKEALTYVKQNLKQEA